jgi:hypothetical protein
MAIESDAQSDLALDGDDAENVAGGKTQDTSKTQIPISPIVGSQIQKTTGPSPDSLEQHL